MTAPIGMPDLLTTAAPSPLGSVDRARGDATNRASAPSEVSATPFTEHLEHIIDNADSAQREAQAKATDFAEHRSNDLHGTMISLTQADIQLRFVASIRNKVIEAYREVMRMGA